ncbi:MAG: MFS transporter [Gammaproteobacteria bacterium]
MNSSAGTGIDRAHRKVILASALGTVFEWYDFFLYGSLSAIISKQFFAGVNDTTAYIFALLAFAAGFFVRPFGALVFGRLGDLIGRKYTFLITILIMGSSTALVGMLPGYATIGVAAPIILITLRLLQGLALGGEYGGAATYVGEHAPEGRRGLYTSWIQTTGTMGLFLSLLVILVCRVTLGDEFAIWGWRIPFLMSIVLLAVSVYIRLQLQESPAFLEIKGRNELSKAPIKEAFGNAANLRLVLFALLGATAGQAVVWYCSQFYALFFLEKVLQVDATDANIMIAASLVLGAPFFVVFGALSDRVGRKPVVMAGCVLAALTYFPAFKALTHFANPALDSAVATAPVTVHANDAECSFQFDPVGKKAFTRSCDVAKAALATSGVPYENEAAAPGESVARIVVGTGTGATVIEAFEGASLSKAEFKTANDGFRARLKEALVAAGYPAKADPARVNRPMVILVCTYLVLLVTMVYGPIAAWLVEMFPTRIRYTAMSLPYHLGNGWFGGFLPVTSFAIVAATGDIYRGLWYPVIVAAATAVIGTLFLRETRTDPLDVAGGKPVMPRP